MSGPFQCPSCGQTHPRGCHGHANLRDDVTGRITGTRECHAAPVTGLTVCVKHGGHSPRARAKSARALAQRKAARSLAKFGQKVEIDSAEALKDLVQWTAGEVMFWRGVVTDIEAEGGHQALTWGVTKVKDGGDDHGTTEEAKPNIAYTMLIDASNRLAAYATAAMKAGVAEREVQLAEGQGAKVAAAQLAILERMLAAVIAMLQGVGVDDDLIIAQLRDAWNAAMGVVVPEELRRLGSGTGE